MIRKIYTLAFVAAMLAVPIEPASAADDAGDKVVARVDGVDITGSDFRLAETDIGPELINVPEDRRRVEILDYLIMNRLLANAAVKEKLDTSSDFKLRLKYYRGRALQDAFIEKKINAAISEEAAKKIYDQQVGSVKPQEEVHARHILVKEEEEAKKLIKELANGKDFAELAKKESKGPSAAQGGDLGYIPKGRTFKEFEETAFALKVGEISEPVKTKAGWHVIKIEDRRTRPIPTFDVVKERLLASLRQRKAQEVIGGLHQKAKIEVLDEDLKKLRKQATRGSFSGQ
ncbi:foldase protein PrsA 1 [bacterium MnTg02]|nr:foldase protein PrsA 1 [bacterium MnTg02]